MKNLVKLLLILFLGFTSSSDMKSQNSINEVIDSLKKLGDTLYDNGNPDSAIIIYNNGIEYCKQTHNSNIFLFYDRKAFTYYVLGKYSDALSIYNEAIGQKDYFNSTQSLADIFFGKATIAMINGKYSESKEFYNEALKLYEVYPDCSRMSEIWINIGLIEKDFTHWDLSINSFNTAEKKLDDCDLNKEIKQYLRAAIYHNIGVSYQEWGRISDDESFYNKAREYLNNALKIRTNLNDVEGIGSSYLCIADNFLLLGDLTNAKSYIELARDKIVGDLKKSTYFLTEGKILAKENEPNHALNSFFKSESIAVKNSGIWEAYQADNEIIKLQNIPDSLINVYKGKKLEIREKIDKESALAQKIIFLEKVEDKNGMQIMNLDINEWLMVSLFSFIISLLLMFVFLRKAKKISDFNLGNQYFYLLLIPAGLASAAFLFGAMNSVATYSGVVIGGELKMGGPIVLFVMVLWLGFKFSRNPEPFDFTIHLQGVNGEVKFKGSVIMEIGNDRKDEKIDHKGSIDFKNIPASFRNQKVKLTLLNDKWVFRNCKNVIECSLKGKSINLILQEKNEN